MHGLYNAKDCISFHGV